VGAHWGFELGDAILYAVEHRRHAMVQYLRDTAQPRINLPVQYVVDEYHLLQQRPNASLRGRQACLLDIVYHGVVGPDSEYFNQPAVEWPPLSPETMGPYQPA
jgi:hypothetical protein